MPRALVYLLATALLVGAVDSQSSVATSGRPDEVVVTNFPPVQQVAGTVTVGAPVPSTRLDTLRAQVPPAGAGEISDWTDAGILDSAGFATVTLSLGGHVQGRIGAVGAVAAVLIPDQPEILQTLRDDGVQQFPLTVLAPVAPTDAAVFQSLPTHLRLGFPRYRVYVYNTTPRTSQVVLYAYLSTS